MTRRAGTSGGRVSRVSGIRLSSEMVELALPEVAVGLRKYLWLQQELRRRDVSSDRDYRRRFCGFYRVRRGPEWQDVYFRMLEREKERAPTLSGVLAEIHAATGRVEASFASKLLATIDPRNPVIDSVVLMNLGLALRSNGNFDTRLRHVVSVYERMAAEFAAALASPEGRYLVTRFGEAYPDAEVSDVKKLDLVLWQTR